MKKILLLLFIFLTAASCSGEDPLSPYQGIDDRPFFYNPEGYNDYVLRNMDFIYATFDRDSYLDMSSISGWQTDFSGNLFYIDPVSGDDDLGDGSAASPFKSVDHVANNLVACSDQNGTAVNPDGTVHSGDALLLMDGDHGVLDIRGKYNSSWITIAAAPGHNPVLKRVLFRGGSCWRLDALTVRSTNEGTLPLIKIENSSYFGKPHTFLIENSIIQSASNTDFWTTEDWDSNTSGGIMAMGNNILIRNNTIRNVKEGITLIGNNCIARGNSIRNYTIDGIRIWGNDIKVEDNRIINPAFVYPVESNHYDGIQVLDSGFTFYGLSIRRNRILFNDNNPNLFYPQQYLQGIVSFDSVLYDAVVMNNIVINRHYHGISMWGARDSRIVNNTVFEPSGTFPVWIHAHASKAGIPCRNLTIRNNITLQIVIETGSLEIITDHNLTSFDTNALFVDWNNNDYHLQSGSPAVDTGSSDGAPETDIDGNNRPYGACDIGAYEF